MYECKHPQIQSLDFSHRLRNRTFNNTWVVTSQNGHNKELLCYITALKGQVCTAVYFRQTLQSTQTNNHKHTWTRRRSNENVFTLLARSIGIHQTQHDTHKNDNRPKTQRKCYLLPLLRKPDYLSKVMDRTHWFYHLCESNEICICISYLGKEIIRERLLKDGLLFFLENSSKNSLQWGHFLRVVKSLQLH